MSVEDFEVSNAVIEHAELVINDRGMLDCWLTLDYGGAGQGFGGWALYLPKSFDHHRIESVAGHHLYRIMEVSGVTKFADLKGKTIRARHNFSHVEAIGHIIKDDWFFPQRDFDSIRKAAA